MLLFCGTSPCSPGFVFAGRWKKKRPSLSFTARYSSSAVSLSLSLPPSSHSFFRKKAKEHSPPTTHTPTHTHTHTHTVHTVPQHRNDPVFPAALTNKMASLTRLFLVRSSSRLATTGVVVVRVSSVTTAVEDLMCDGGVCDGGKCVLRDCCGC